MKNPAYELIQARKVKARLRMLQHAQRISGNVSQTCRFFGVSRALYYIWKERYKRHGQLGSGICLGDHTRSAFVFPRRSCR
jgi:transposase-like protein